MAIVELENGKQIEFDGTPTQEQIEDAVRQLGFAKSDVPKPKSSSSSSPLNQLGQIMEPFLKPQVSPTQAPLEVVNRASGAFRQFAQESPGVQSIVSKLSSKPFGVAQSIGQALPQEIPFAHPGDIQASSIPFGSAISELSPKGLAKGAIGQVLDPLVLAMGLNPNIRALRLSPQKLSMAGERALQKAENLTTQVIRPDINKLGAALEKGETLPSVKRAAERMTTSSDFSSLAQNIDKSISEIFNERNAILQANNKNVYEPVVNKFFNVVKEEETRLKNTPLRPREIKVMDRFFNDELEWLSQNPNLDRVMAQARKELLQDEAAPLYRKRDSQEGLTGFEPVKLKVADALQRIYKEVVEEGLEKVSSINEQYGGLLEARRLLGRQAAIGKLDVPQDAIQTLSRSLGFSPKFTMGRAALRKIEKPVEKFLLGRSTERISRLMEQSKLFNNLAKEGGKLKRQELQVLLKVAALSKASRPSPNREKAQ